MPAIMPVLATVVTLRTIWMFYMFADVYLLTTRSTFWAYISTKPPSRSMTWVKQPPFPLCCLPTSFAVIRLTRKG
ncbi:hypothetical protein ACVXG7_21295 [Enterobacter hormaechei]